MPASDPPSAARPPDLRPTLDPAALSVAHYPAGWWPPSAVSGYAAIVADLDEVTLVAPDAFFETLDEPLAIERGWHRITFAGPLPWEMIGFLADVAGRLAGARIPFTSMSGFTTDHVLVRAAQSDLALAVLRGEEPPDQRPDVTNP